MLLLTELTNHISPAITLVCQLKDVPCKDQKSGYDLVPSLLKKDGQHSAELDKFLFLEHFGHPKGGEGYLK